MRGRADMNMESKSYKDALDFYVQALKLGCVKSTFTAATMFDNALGCEQDLELAFMLYKAAYEGGNFFLIANFCLILIFL